MSVKVKIKYVNFLLHNNNVCDNTYTYRPINPKTISDFCKKQT